MNPHTKAQEAKVTTALPLVSVGRVKRSYSVQERVALASNDARYDAVTTGDSLTAWARRATASSGFGDAATAPAMQLPSPDAMQLAIAARAQQVAADTRRARDSPRTARARYAHLA